ncbi:hypothetical protein WA158_005633 [Blastocystis sp. Blastoise]
MESPESTIKLYQRVIQSIYSSILSTLTLSNVTLSLLFQKNPIDTFTDSDSTKPNIRKNTNNSVDRHSFQPSNGMETLLFLGQDISYAVRASQLDQYKGTYIDEMRENNQRTSDGYIYIDYKTDHAQILADYIEGQPIHYELMSQTDILSFLDLIMFLNLPLSEELAYHSRTISIQRRIYSKGKKCKFLFNGQEDLLIMNYINSHHLVSFLEDSKENQETDYNFYEDLYILDFHLNYINYIYEYIVSGTITINNDISYTKNPFSLYKELSILGFQDINTISRVITTDLNGSNILSINHIQVLKQWLRKEQKWILLYRGSRDGYSAESFHNHCDKKGPTVTIIKHIGHNNCINIFGGYTETSWESCTTAEKREDSNAFLFTLKNEFNISPTKYNILNKKQALCCYYKLGPTFGIYNFDLQICNECHSICHNMIQSNQYAHKQTSQQNSLFVNTAENNKTNMFLVEDIEVYGQCL